MITILNNYAASLYIHSLKNGWLELECVTPIEAHSPVKLLNHTKNRAPDMSLYVYMGMQMHAQYVLLLLVLAGNSDWHEAASALTCIQRYLLLW